MCKQRSRTGLRRYAAISKQTLSFLLAVGPVVLGANPAQGAFGFDTPLGGAPLDNMTSFWTAWSVATDSKHNVHVIYMGESPTEPGEPPDRAPYYRKYDDLRGEWDLPIRLTPAFPSYVIRNYIAIATDCGNNVHTLWAEYVPGTGPTYLRYKRADSTGTWGLVEDVRTILSDYPNSIEGISLAADQRGNAYAVWCEASVAPDFTVVWNAVSRIRDAGSGGWNPSRQLTGHLPPSGIGAIHPTIAVQNFWATYAGFEEAVAHIAWYEWLGTGTGNVGYMALGYDKDGVETLYDDGLLLPAGESSYPSIAARCQTVHLVWRPLTGGLLVHQIGSTPASGPGGAAFDVPVPTGLLVGPGPIAVDHLESVHLVTRTGVYPAINVVKYVWSKMLGVWDPVPTVVTDVPGTWDWPSIASDERADLHVVWTGGTGATAGVYYDRGTCMAVPIAPPDVPSTMATFTADLSAARQAAHPDEFLPVIIHMREQPDWTTLEESVVGRSSGERRQIVLSVLDEFAARSQSGILADLAVAADAGEATEIRSLSLINAIAANAKPSLLDRLLTRSDVSVIDHDPVIPMLDATSETPTEMPPNEHLGQAKRSLAPGASPTEGLNAAPSDFPRTPAAPTTDIAWNVDWIGAPAVWAMGYQGDCILVAVLDTGIDLRHSDLMGRLWSGAQGHGWDFVNGDDDPTDDNGHGTHVAGTIAGDGTGGTRTGVAPQARLMAVKVLNAGGGGSWGNIIAGIGYALANHAQVLNLSLGGRCQSFIDRGTLRTAADVAALAGVTMCVAAGNERCNDRPPNMMATPGDVPPPWLPGVPPFAGTTSGVTTVGATDMSDVIAGFSNPGPVDWSQVEPTLVYPYFDWWVCDPIAPGVGLIKPDVCAPGKGINSTVLGGGYSGNTWNGTSMATPHVAGLAALILSRNSNLLSAGIHSILETSAIDFGPPGKDNDYGAGRIDALAAISATNDPPNGAPLVLLSRRIDDTGGGGNGDGALDAGETADLMVTLYNQGAYVIGNVLGILSTTDVYVQVTDGFATFGDIPPFETRENVGDRFSVIVDSGAPEGHVVHFELIVDGDGACALFTFDEEIGAAGGDDFGACCLEDGCCRILLSAACTSVGGQFQGVATVCAPNPCAPDRPDFADHDVGQIRLTMTDQGIVGFMETSQAQGSGMVYPIGGANHLYIGGLWVGQDASYVASRDFDADPAKEWVVSACPDGRIRTATLESDDDLSAMCADTGAGGPGAFFVEQDSWSFSSPMTDDDFAIVRYTLNNQGGTDRSGMFLGLMLDLDMRGEGTDDRGSTDAARKMAYMTDNGGVYAGLRILDPPGQTQPYANLTLIPNVTYVYPNQYILDADKFAFLAASDPQHIMTDGPNPADYCVFISAGPFDLPAGGAKAIAFLIVGAESLAQLLQNADQAQLIYNETVDVPEDLTSSGSLSTVLLRAVPNPTRGDTSIRFALPLAGNAMVSVYDVAGVLVRRLSSGALGIGEHAVPWDGHDEQGKKAESGIYFVRLQSQRAQKSHPIVLVR